MLSQKCKYAIRVVLYLSVATRESVNLKGAKDVSKVLKLPLAFTGKILQELARENIISSLKGPGGGFFLTQENLDIPLIRIIEEMGDITYFESCGLGLSECSEDHPCPIHDIFKVSRDNLLSLFKSKTIGDLANDIKESELFLVR